MDLPTVENGIAVILKRELEYQKGDKLGTLRFTLIKERKLMEYETVTTMDTLPLLVHDPKREKIRSDNFETLLSLYQKALAEGITKENFLEVFVKVLGQMKAWHMNRLLNFCLLFLFRIRELLWFVRIRSTYPSAKLASPILKLRILDMISQILRYDYELVDENDIVVFKEIISTLLPKPHPHPKAVPTGFPGVLGTGMAQPTVTPTSVQDNPFVKRSKLIDKQITELQFRNLRRRLADINPVINEDKQRSMKILDELGFDLKFSDALNTIEDYFRKGELDEQEAATCISKIGSFVQDFNLELIRRIEQIKGEKFTGKTESVASTIQYLKKNSIGFFDDKIADVYKSVYDLCSATGRHHLVSAKEDARICKNIMIELVLLVLQKLNKYSSKREKEHKADR